MRNLLILLAALALPAAAQEAYPSKAVKLVAPFPAAGPLDLLARLMAQKLGEQWGIPVVVENITGATGSIGANAVARAAPDGHTLLITVDIPLTMYPAIARSLPYDPEKSFKPACSSTPRSGFRASRTWSRWRSSSRASSPSRPRASARPGISAASCSRRSRASR
jgi:tripartite-type tricarboxylate transporter receptor subunit TctC